jgi:hypothetical protein
LDLQLWVYLELLNFFSPGGEYHQAREKLVRKASSMLNLSELVSLGANTGFYHHGKVKYLFSFFRNGEKFYITLTAHSRSPEGTEPTCLISSSPNAQGQPLEVRPFQELAKLGLAELKPWLKLAPSSVAPPLAGPLAPSPAPAPAPAPALALASAAYAPDTQPVSPPIDVAQALQFLQGECDKAAQIAKQQQQQQQQKKKEKTAADKRLDSLFSSPSPSSSSSSPGSPPAAAAAAAAAARSNPQPRQNHQSQGRYKEQPDMKRCRQ